LRCPLHDLHLPPFPTRRSSDLTTALLGRRHLRPVLSPDLPGRDWVYYTREECAFESSGQSTRKYQCRPHSSRRRGPTPPRGMRSDRKSTRLNSSHVAISYAVFC